MQIQDCLRISIAGFKQRAAWGGKGFFCLHSQVTVYHGRKPGQDLKQCRNLEAEAVAETIEGCYKLACLSWLAQLAFL